MTEVPFANTLAGNNLAQLDLRGGDFAPQPMAADPVRVGGEILVNTQTAGDQYGQIITGLTNGGFVVTWIDTSSTSGDIKAQLFSAAGAKLGGEFFVNTQTANEQGSPTITGLTNGGFVVSWYDTSGTLGDTSGTSIKAQLFDAAGAMVGSEFRVNTQTLNDQIFSKATGLSNGGFVVTWNDTSLIGGDASAAGIKAQVFSAAGAKVGSEFLVNTQTADFQTYPTITGLTNGGFVVTWTDASGTLGDAIQGSIKAQLFSAAGAKLGSEFLVNTQTAGSQYSPTITGLSNGGFVVTWVDSIVNGVSDVKAQVFSAAGAKLGIEFLVNIQTASDQLNPTITGLSNGGFVVTWEDSSGTLGDASISSIKAQLFDAAGAKVGSEFLVNTQTAGAQGAPTITGLTNGGFVVTWYDTSGIGGDASGYGIKAQIFSVAAPNTPPAGTDAVVAIDEDVPRVLAAADFGFSDSDGNALLAVKITTLPGAGTLTLNGSAVTAGTFVAVSEIAAGHLVFTPALNANGTGYASFTFQVQDNGGTASGGVDLDQSPNTLSFDVAAVNDAPVNTVPGAQTGTANTPLVFSTAFGNALSVADVDAGSAMVRVKLIADHGAITVAAVAGLTIKDNGTHFVVLRGTLSAINTALDGLSYQGDPGYTGSDTLTITTNDRANSGSGGMQIDFDSVAITLAPAMAPADPKAANLAIENSGGFDFGGLVALAPAVFDPFAFAGFGNLLRVDPGNGAAKAEFHAHDPGDFAIHALVLDIHGSLGSDFML